jgi:prepilin-type N-terminal cleavage/methylation domain-containing protein
MKLRRVRAFTLVELLAVIGVIGVLASLFLPVFGATRRTAREAVSVGNLRQLAVATHSYIADNRGFFPPGMSFDNNTRWHGARASVSAPFDPARGWLGPYLGRDGRVKVCPEFAALELAPGSFETGAGGYGYNLAYLGGPIPDTPKGAYRPARLAALPRPGRTVLFATTALARAGGVQEYPFAEAPRWRNPGGGLEGENQPSVHFRFGGRALVAWCDGRVGAEAPNPAGWPGVNYYGGDNAGAKIGWFGPLEANGYWNPEYAGKNP